jgi:8-oxo-dGTP pyrophosphatase MutT (NUDIX family)
VFPFLFLLSVLGGRAENGESLAQAAIRETKEEAGIDVELKGILRMEYYSEAASNRNQYGHTRLRVIYYGEPRTTAIPSTTNPDSTTIISTRVDGKSLPDFESVGSCWIDVEDLQKMYLRGKEPLKWFNYIKQGGEIYPLSILKH